MNNPLEAFKLWAVDKSLAYHQAEVERLLEWLSVRQKGVVERAENVGDHCGLMDGQFFKLRSDK